MKKLLMIVNEDRFFLSHRREIALAAQKEGLDVTVVCKDTGRRNEVEALGLTSINIGIRMDSPSPSTQATTPISNIKVVLLENIPPSSVWK